MSVDFSSFGFEPFLLQALEKKAIKEPTDIQEKVIPEILDGQDVIARSKTGSGKTLAFLLPVIQKIEQENKELQALILAPTNELAAQIFDVVKELTADSPIVSDLFLGSANIKRQLEKLKKSKPQIAVGTPMRVWDLAEKKKLKVHQVKQVVVDEADRMFEEKGALKTYQTLVSRIGKDAQYVFVSATITNDFQDIVSDHVSVPVFISSEQKLDTSQVEHYYVVCDERERIGLASRLIRTLNIKKGILFLNHLDKVNETTQKLQYKGIEAGSLSADSSKTERATVMKNFQAGKVNILVGSDLAARGLDISDVTHIINIHPPVDADTYIHRAGRTGRMGKAGTVISLITEKERFIIDKFKKKLEIEIEERDYSRGKLQTKTRLNNDTKSKKK